MITLRWLISIIVFSSLVIGGYMWWLHSQRYPATSDAYIGAHVVRIAPQVGGMVAELPVTDHARVATGQLLLAIDPESYEIAQRRAEANVALADHAQAGAQAAVDASQAEVSERDAEHDDALRNNERMQELLKQKSVAQAQADTARYKLREATAALADARSGLQQSVRKLDESGARVRIADAALAQARLDLSHTRITAPVSGVLGTLDVRPGDIVTAGQQLFPLVDDSAIWVDANYKETDLHRIRIGQLAATVLTRMTQVNWNRLGGDINPFNPALHQWLVSKGLVLSDPAAIELLAVELRRQATMLGFIDAFWFIMWCFIILAPMLFILRRRTRGDGKVVKNSTLPS